VEHDARRLEEERSGALVAVGDRREVGGGSEGGLDVRSFGPHRGHGHTRRTRAGACQESQRDRWQAARRSGSSIRHRGTRYHGAVRGATSAELQ
jgi:hypothetical protein